MIKYLFYDETTYYLLIENFNKIGRLADADNCYLDSKRSLLEKDWKEYINAPESSKHIENLYKLEVIAILFYITGYNKKPWAILWSINFVLILGLYWGFALRASNRFMDEYSRDWDKSTDLRSDQMLIKGMIFSFNLFFSGSSLSIIKPPPPPDLPIGSNIWAQRVYLLERLYGTLLTIFVSMYLAKTLSGI